MAVEYPLDCLAIKFAGMCLNPLPGDKELGVDGTAYNIRQAAKACWAKKRIPGLAYPFPSEVVVNSTVVVCRAIDKLSHKRDVRFCTKLCSYVEKLGASISPLCRVQHHPWNG